MNENKVIFYCLKLLQWHHYKSDIFAVCDEDDGG